MTPNARSDRLHSIHTVRTAAGADLVPTAEHLTAVYNATTDYSIREEDRALLLDGPSDQTLPIARAWGCEAHTPIHPVHRRGTRRSGHD
jgi:hypothetical protein